MGNGKKVSLQAMVYTHPIILSISGNLGLVLNMVKLYNSLIRGSSLKEYSPMGIARGEASFFPPKITSMRETIKQVSSTDTVDVYISRRTKNTRAFFRRIRRTALVYIKSKIIFYIVACLQMINPTAMDNFRI